MVECVLVFLWGWHLHYVSRTLGNSCCMALNGRYGQKFLLTHILEVLAFLPKTPFFWGKKGEEPSCVHPSLGLPRKH